MILTALLFIGAIVSAALVAPLLSVPLTPLLLPARAIRSLAPIATAAVAGIAVAVAMLLFAWVTESLGRDPSLWMFLIPYLLILRNDLDRIRRAWVGNTPVRLQLEAEGQIYDAPHQAYMEIGSLIGDTIGLWTAFFLAVRP